MKLKAYDSTTGGPSNATGNLRDDSHMGETAVDVWDESDPQAPHPILRIWYADGEHNRDNLLNYILKYKEEA